MIPLQPSDVTIRLARKEDAATCGQICFDAFATISKAHGFPPDVPSPEIAVGLMTVMFTAPGLYCTVAESGGRILGSNCMDERATIHGIDPITIDPTAQNLGLGRKLMEDALAHAEHRRAAGVRLVQAAFHNRSLSLYSNLGFDIREPLSCMQGRTKQRTVSGCTVRTAQQSDLQKCSELSRRVHGFDRSADLSFSIQEMKAKVVEREGRITGYTSELAFFGHATAESNADLQALIASTETDFGGPGVLVPMRNHQLFRWCLTNGLRVVQPMTLMTMGLYNEPDGAWLPSILF